MRRSRSAFAITDMELSVMAALAHTGPISVPVSTGPLAVVTFLKARCLDRSGGRRRGW